MQNAAGDLGRARRYGWPADRQAILAETLAAARARFAAVKNGGETRCQLNGTPRNRAGQLVATEDVAERDALILRLLAQGLSYGQVVEMGLPGIKNRGCVSKARRRALDAIRAPAVEQYRAETLAKLDALEEGAWQDVRDPGPKVSVTGQVVRDGDGEPLPDNSVRDAARNTVLKAIRTRMDLLGLAAPKRSMSLQATVELDSENETLQAQLAEAYSRRARREGTRARGTARPARPRRMRPARRRWPWWPGRTASRDGHRVPPLRRR